MCYYLKRPVITTYVIVIVQSLFDHIKLPVFSWVISYSGTIEPVSIVAADVMVYLTTMKDNSNQTAAKSRKHQTTPSNINVSHQQVFKPLSAQSPV